LCATVLHAYQGVTIQSFPGVAFNCAAGESTWLLSFHYRCQPDCQATHRPPPPMVANTFGFNDIDGYRYDHAVCFAATFATANENVKWCFSSIASLEDVHTVIGKIACSCDPPIKASAQSPCLCLPLP
jgi:hypothetical protein